MAEHNPLLDAALEYAKGKFPVFPLHYVKVDGSCSCGKVDCDSPGKHPKTKHGFKDSTTDPDQIKKWWTKTPDANIGIRTGKQSRLLVIDSDEKNGKSGYRSITEASLATPDTWTVQTPSGGLHYYYQYPAGEDIGCADSGLDGVDIRGEGGYVVAPPSVIDGKSYTVASQAGIALLSSQWVGQLTKRRHPPVQGDSGPILDGTRNKSLTSFAGRMRFYGLSPSEIQAALLVMDSERCEPPVGPEKVATIARWAGKHPIGDYSSLVDLSNFTPPPLKVDDNPNPPSTPHNCTRLEMVSAADVVPERVRWVWPGVFPQGKISIITGMAGTNKTTLGIDVTARISSGLRWPSGSISASTGTVIFASGEDDAADTLVPRLMAAGANLGNVNLLTGVNDTTKGKEARRTFRLDSDIGLLERAIVTSKATAVLIDPLSAFVGGTETHADASVRALLEPLRHLAETYKVAVIGIMHPPKAQYAELVSMISGSAAFGNAARAVWLIARDPDDEDRRLMLPAKLNLASDRFGFAYRKELVDVENIGQQVRIEWDEERIDKMVTLERMRQVVKPSKVAEARKFIVEYMRDKDICPAAEITAEASACGINLATLHKARKELGYETERRGGRDGGNVWFPKNGWPLKVGTP
jgi:hypothetical protein